MMHQETNGQFISSSLHCAYYFLLCAHSK